MVLTWGITGVTSRRIEEVEPWTSHAPSTDISLGGGNFKGGSRINSRNLNSYALGDFWNDEFHPNREEKVEENDPGMPRLLARIKMLMGEFLKTNGSQQARIVYTGKLGH